MFPLEALRENVQRRSSSFWWFLALLGVSGLLLWHSSLCSHLHVVFPLCACVCPSTPVIRTLVTRRGLTLLLYEREVKVPQLCPRLSLQPHGLYSPWNSPGQKTGAGSLSLLQGIFPTQGSNSDLLRCRWIFYQLSHKGSPRILEWVAHPFSSGSSQLRNRTGVSCIAGGFFTN